MANLAAPTRAVTVEPPFDRKAAQQALRVAAERTSVCFDRRHFGTANVLMTFAPSGRVKALTIAGGELGRSPVGICILDQMQTARVPAFSGPEVTLQKTIHFR